MSECAIHQRHIGHDNNFVITQFFNIKFFLANTGSHGGDECISGCSTYGQTGHVQHSGFYHAGQNSLILLVTGLLGRPTAEPLNDKEFRF